MIRVVDDSGEDYLYPAALFEAVEVQEQTAAQPYEPISYSDAFNTHSRI